MGERWPDAPGLPDGYRFDAAHLHLGIYSQFTDRMAVPIGLDASLALCVTMAMEIGRWWELQEDGRNVMLTSSPGGAWWTNVYGPNRDTINDEHDDLPTAALTMLRGIVEP